MTEYQIDNCPDFRLKSSLVSYENYSVKIRIESVAGCNIMKLRGYVLAYVTQTHWFSPYHSSY